MIYTGDLGVWHTLPQEECGMVNSHFPSDRCRVICIMQIPQELCKSPSFKRLAAEFPPCTKRIRPQLLGII